MNDFYSICPNNEPVGHFCGYGPVSVLIQVTGPEQDSFAGVAIPLCGSVPPFAFSSFVQLTALLDTLCDELGHPVRTDRMNSFSSGSANPLRLVPAQPVTARKLGHFTIEILYRQNQSMQGRIIVPDRDEPAGRQSFRSDIELLHLMREYMA